MKDESLHPWIEPELEARIVALVLGEASDFEKEELERLIGEKPELGLFRDRIESMHTMLRSNGKTASLKEEGEWKLSPERRGAVLDVLGGDAADPSGAKEVPKRPNPERRRVLPALLKVAAVVALLAAFVGVMMPASSPMMSRGGKDTARPTSGMIAFREGATDELDAVGTSLSSLDVDAERFMKSVIEPTPAESGIAAAGSERASRYSSIGHGGSTADLAISGQAIADHSEITVSAGKEVKLRQDDQRLAELSDDGSSLLAANGPQSNGQVRMHYYDGSYDHTRAKMLTRVAEGWETPVPQLKAEESSADSPEKLAAATAGTKTEGVNFGLVEENKNRSLAFPEAPGAPVVVSRFGAGRLAGEDADTVSDLRTTGALPQADLADNGDGGVSAGYASDYVFVNPRDLKAKKVSEKQHAGTVSIGGKVVESREGESDRFYSSMNSVDGVIPELEESEAIALRTQSATPAPGQIDISGKDKTVDQLFRRERPVVVAAPVSEAVVNPAELQLKKLPQRLLREIPSDLTESSAKDEPFSTFSLHVSDVSFKLAQAALAKGEWPDAERIRIEEFVNAFDYGDPLPGQDEKVSAVLEQTIHPFLQQRNLLRVSMRTAETGRNASTPLRLTFLLDNSGSMERSDRRDTVRSAFAVLASMLHPSDEVTLISFARQPRLLADRVAGDQADSLVETVANLPSEGGTNLEAALDLAFEKALEQKTPGAQNRIILLTDGAANLGDARPEKLAARVETMRNAGIAFDAAGIGTVGLNDEILEALTRKGDGRYYLLDRKEDVDAGFAKQIAGALRPAAGNVKIQMEFNPDRVGKYKLLGFEKHRLNKEDFRDDKVDAAELASAEAGVAVYQIETLADGEGEIGAAFVRFRDMATGEMTERRWTIPYQSHPARPEEASPSMQVAIAAAMLGAKLKGGVLGEVVDLAELSQIVSQLPQAWREKPRLVELTKMIESARSIAGQ
ncbi:MAG: von Willebrand factor type A domain-containing protein [Verrucomicrobiales bacterium]|nr:von Willebrand factor type A domain-containing protein [Verrucomicrobiales bacterium]